MKPGQFGPTQCTLMGNTHTELVEVSQSYIIVSFLPLPNPAFSAFPFTAIIP